MISVAEHHRLTLLESYRSQNTGAGASFLLTSLPPYFLTSKSERLIYVPKTTHQSPVPIPERPRPALSHADRPESPSRERSRAPDALRLPRRPSQGDSSHRGPRGPRRRPSRRDR